MDKKNNTLLAAGLVAGLVVYLMFSLNNKIASLENQFHNFNQTLQNSALRIENNMSSRVGDIENSLKAGNSIFSRTAIKARPQGNKLVVEMTAVPKEIQSGQVQLARVQSGGKVYEATADGNGYAEVTIDMVTSFVPVFVIQRGDTVLQEALPEEYTDRFTYLTALTEWVKSDDSKVKDTLRLAILKEAESFSIDESMVAKAEFIVEDNGKDGDASQTPQSIEVPEGDVVNAIPVTAQNGEVVAYTGDFSKFAEVKNHQYGVYFVLTLKDGLTYMSEGNVAGVTFSNKGDVYSESGQMGLRIVMPK